MKLPRVYQEGFVASSGGEHCLEPEASHHLGVVLKLGAGEKFIICDGRGNDYLSRVIFSGDRRRPLEGRIEKRLEPSGQLSRELHLGIALCKGDRFERLIEKAAELGVASLLPLVTARSLSHERGQKLDRWQRIAREACSLAGRSRWMSVREPSRFEELIGSSSRGVLFHQGAPFPFCRGAAREQIHPLWLVVGPEGGFTDREVELARGGEGWQVGGLGARNLRVETAAIVAVSLALLENGEFEVVDDDSSRP